MVWNSCSLNNKADDFMIMLQDDIVDIAYVSETWLTDNANCTTALIKSYGFEIMHNFRIDGRGGGTALVFKSNLLFNVCNVTTDIPITSFGYTTASFKLAADIKMCLVCVYRTGPVTKCFFEEYNNFMQAIALKSDYVIVGGDFNIHVETSNSFSSQLLDIMESYGFSQIVNQPTHQLGGTIDLLFDNSNLLDTDSLKVHTDVHLSDHFPITCMTKEVIVDHKEARKIKFRSLKSMDRVNFTEELFQSIDSYNCSPLTSLEESVTDLNAMVQSLLDEHAPMIEKTISYLPHAPWFDNEYKEQRTLRRKAEKKAKKKDATLDDKLLYKQIMQETTKMSTLKKQQYYRKKIDANENDVRAVYNVLNREMDRKQSCPLPDADDMPALAREFNEFFIGKIDKIRKNFDQNLISQDVINPSSNLKDECIMDSFEPTTIEELREIIKDSGIKSSPSDMLPTELLKENVDVLLPALCDLVNLSLSTGSMEGLKVADVIPTIKGFGNDPNEKKNYRPISNLTFLGKLIERVVLRRLNEHLDKNNLTIPNQSAYRKNHSTETILLKVTNDLLIASDRNSATILMLLDLSAAFDTVDHKILLKILQEEIGITGKPIKWFESFLSGRCQRIRLGSTVSEAVYLLFGVPQGSVLGPVLFNIYIRSLYETVKRTGFSIEGYADDHQVYVTFLPASQSATLTIALQNCFSAIEQWMHQYCLQLNPGKTQLMVVGPPKVLKNIHISGAVLTSGICIRFVKFAKNLGMIFDDTMTFKKQILELKKDSFRLIRMIKKLRFLFNEKQLKLLVNSLIVCKLDYCNALYYGINESLLNELQMIQNAAGKTVFGLYKYDHVGDTLKKLHWLPVRSRITFKILLTVYKTLNGKGPKYLSDMLQYSNVTHAPYLLEPSTLSKYGDRAFSKAGPSLWNKLPTDIKTCSTLDYFKICLKTHLFKEAYEIA